MQTVVLLLGPVVLPKLIATIRSLRAGGSNASPKVLARSARLSINILVAIIIVALASSFQYFQDENIIRAVGARLLMTPSDVLSHRLELLRLKQGFDRLQSDDTKLLDFLKSRDGRLLYATFGPKPILNCTWCSISNPTTYLYYAIPTIALPHVVHVALLGLITSTSLSAEGKTFRIHATVAGIGVALGEMILLYNFELPINTRAIKQDDVIWYHWRLRAYRGVLIAALDSALAIILYLHHSGRYGLNRVTDREKIEAITNSLDSTIGNVRMGLFVKSASVRSGSISKRAMEFWDNELLEKKTVSAEVEEARASVLERVNEDLMTDEAFKFISALLDAFRSSTTKLSTQT